MPNRINLDDAVGTGRQTIDASWSKGKKTGVGIAASAIALGAVGAGVFAFISSQPPKLPTSASQAVLVMSSSKYDKLDEGRQRQYAAEAGRLIRELSDEERSELFANEGNREAMNVLREEMFDEMSRSFARGEQMQVPWGRRPGGNDGGERRERPQMSAEDRANAMSQMRDRINDAVREQISSGNAQDGSLRGEFFKRRFSGGGRPGGG